MKITKPALFAIIIFLSATSGSAQQKNAGKPWQFLSINNLGLLEGETGSAIQLQTINGFQNKSWFAGVGVGLDYYRFRSIPLFVDVRKEFGKKENKLFIYADAGVNFYWKRNKDPKQFYGIDKFKSGFYGEAGFGYKFKLHSKLNLLLAGGYAYKNLTENGYNYPLLVPGGIMMTGGGPQSTGDAKIVYNLNRLVFKLGIEF